VRTSLFTLLLALLLFQGCASHFFYPDQNQYATPKDYGLEYEDVEFTSSDQTTLHAWHIYPPQSLSRGLIFVAHGNAQNLSSHFVSWVWLIKQGYEVFIFDYREYGKSEGKSSIEGSIADTKAALDYLEGQRQEPYIAVGQSLGGTMLLNALSQRDNAQIKAVVIDSTFVGFSDIASAKMNDIWLTWPFQWIPSLTLSGDFDAKDRVAQVHKPLLFIHGSLDKVISPNNSWQLFETTPMPREFWIVKESEHIQGLANENVQKAFLEFLSNADSFYHEDYSSMKIFE